MAVSDGVFSHVKPAFEHVPNMPATFTADGDVAHRWLRGMDILCYAFAGEPNLRLSVISPGVSGCGRG